MITHQKSLEEFHKQLEFVLSNYTPHNLKATDFQNIVIGGLGGSGIGGTITKGLFVNQSPVPIEVVNDYTLPAYVGEKSLVILGSYSGNTEETLALFDDAKSRNAHILIQCAGGKLKELAEEHGIKYYTLENGFQPRMALGYSLGFLLKIFAELMGESIDEQLNAVAKSLQENRERFIKSASEIQKKFQSTLNRRYTIICDSAFYGVAMRFAQQLNENSKQEAFVSVLPEANHNMIESYYGQLPSNFILLNSNSNERVSARFDFVAGLLEKENNKLAQIITEGVEIATVFEITYILDWFSILITEPLDVNPMQIENIVSLKEFLSEY